MTFSDSAIEEAIRYKLYVLQRRGIDPPGTLDEFVASLHLVAADDYVKQIYRQMTENNLPAYG